MNKTHLCYSLIYVLVLLYTSYRIIRDTDSPTKASAYLMLIYAFPVIGILTYYIVGVNYRKEKIYDRKLIIQDQTLKEVTKELEEYNNTQLKNEKEALSYFYPLANFLKIQRSVTSVNNQVDLLINGENKFPRLLEDLKQAKNHIHIQYYIFEDDDTGNAVGDILIQKVKEGVEVRFMYDDFGSSSLHKKFIKKLKDAGVEVYPFYKITFRAFMSRINYRNHRKIVVIDGDIGYVGGINVSNKYINNVESFENEMFWRDTHIRISGIATMNLQFIFMTDWNFCSGQSLPFSDQYFSYQMINESFGDKFVQVCYSGPDSKIPNIMYSLIQAMLLCRKELLITNPYFIPEKSFVDALKIASASGVDVKLIVPGKSDSYVVNGIAKTYYQELMDEGIEIYRYQKGFVHAKTMVCDSRVAFVGTANLDERSFNLNFEVNATIYDKDFSVELRNQFSEDLKDCIQIDPEAWRARPEWEKFIDKLMRLASPLM